MTTLTTGRRAPRDRGRGTGPEVWFHAPCVNDLSVCCNSRPLPEQSKGGPAQPPDFAHWTRRCRRGCQHRLLAHVGKHGNTVRTLPCVSLNTCAGTSYGRELRRPQRRGTRRTHPPYWRRTMATAGRLCAPALTTGTEPRLGALAVSGQCWCRPCLQRRTNIQLRRGLPAIRGKQERAV
jgi:hypothetical protein